MEVINLAEREYKRNDKGRFASKDEKTSEQLDSEMNGWFIAQLKGNHDQRRKLLSRVLAGLPTSGQEAVRDDR